MRAASTLLTVITLRGDALESNLDAKWHSDDSVASKQPRLALTRRPPSLLFRPQVPCPVCALGPQEREGVQLHSACTSEQVGPRPTQRMQLHQASASQARPVLPRPLLRPEPGTAGGLRGATDSRTAELSGHVLCRRQQYKHCRCYTARKFDTTRGCTSCISAWKTCPPSMLCCSQPARG